MHFLTVAAIILAFRALDLATTWLASPDLSREINPLYRAMGWRQAILFNLLCALFAADHTATVVVCVGSVMCAVWNVCVWIRHSPQAVSSEEEWRQSLSGRRCWICQKPYEEAVKESITRDGKHSFTCTSCYDKLTQP